MAQTKPYMQFAGPIKDVIQSNFVSERRRVMMVTASRDTIQTES